jgi:hypothetical protein
MKNILLWGLTPCGSCKKRRFEGTCQSVTRLLTLFFARGFFSTLKWEATRSSETSVLTRSTRRHISEGGILQNRQWFSWHSICVSSLFFYVMELVSCHTHNRTFYAANLTCFFYAETSSFGISEFIRLLFSCNIGSVPLANSPDCCMACVSVSSCLVRDALKCELTKTLSGEAILKKAG